MADWYGDFADELQELVLSTWDITEEQYFSSLNALRQNLLNKIRDEDESALDAITFPIAVACVGDDTPEDGFGLGQEFYRTPVRIYWIDRMDRRTNQRTARGKAYDLQNAVYDGNFTHFQEIERGRIESSDLNPANQAFIDKKLSVISACVSWEPGLLVGGNDVS
jgi:hypothetical protein